MRRGTCQASSDKGIEAEKKHMKEKIRGLTLCAVLFALCIPADAQQPTKIPRIGYLAGSSPSTILARIEAFRKGLRDLGYVEGKNIVIEWRSVEGKADRLPGLAAEFSASEGGSDRNGRSDSNPCREGGNCHNSDCHGAG